MNSRTYASLFFCLLLIGCDRCATEESWEDKDVDFLIAKLDSRRQWDRIRAVWQLQYKTEPRDKIIAALTHTLLNDTHEENRSDAAHVLSVMTPPAVEAVPELIEALLLPPEDRGKPHTPLLQDVPSLEMQVEWTLEKLGTPEALAAIDEFKRMGPTLLESSVPDGVAGVDPDVINENGIALRLRGDIIQSKCELFKLPPSRRTLMWSKTFWGNAENAVTLKPGWRDPKLASGTTYTLKIRLRDSSDRWFRTTITFTTKE